MKTKNLDMAGFKENFWISEDVSSEIRPLIDIEREIEEVNRKDRSLLIKLLSGGDFDKAEKKGEEVFEDKTQYYEFVANVTELLQSRHLHRAMKQHQRAFNESDMYKVSIDSLRKAKQNIEIAEDKMESSKKIMKRYSHKFHEIDEKGDKFEKLVENFNDNKKTLKKLKQIQSQFEGVE